MHKVRFKLQKYVILCIKYYGANGFGQKYHFVLSKVCFKLQKTSVRSQK